VVGEDHCFCHLSYYGAKNAEQVSDRYWELVARKGRDDNPYRFSFLQLIGVGETDAEAEDLYAEHAEYFFHKLLYTPTYYQAIPGCLEYEALVQSLRHNPRASINLRELKAKDLFDRGFVVVGSPKTVREQLLDGIKRLRMGHLLALLHFGSMPTALCKNNNRSVCPRSAALSRGPVGRQVTRTAGGPSASRPSVLPPRWPPLPRSWRRVDMAAPEVCRLSLWQDRIQTEVEISGRGRPLVYLHGPWGLAPDRAFVAGFADDYTVYAPKFPGTTHGNPDAVHALDNWFDLIVYHGELFDRLELSAPAVIGHSFGGLLAAEFAAAAPKSVGRLVLIDPVGLWRDDAPVKNWMILSDKVRRPLLLLTPTERPRGASSMFRAIRPSASTRSHSSSGRKPALVNSSGRSLIADSAGTLTGLRRRRSSSGARPTASSRRFMLKSLLGESPTHGSNSSSRLVTCHISNVRRR